MGQPGSLTDCHPGRAGRLTQGTETSEYLQEEKTKCDSPSSGERPGNSPNRPGSGQVGVVGLRDGKINASGSVWKVAPQTVIARYAKQIEA